MTSPPPPARGRSGRSWPLPGLLRLDPYLVLLAAVMGLATLLPARGSLDTALSWISDGAIALLFFLQGARLSRAAIVSGLSAGRLHLIIVAATYLAFPALALAVVVCGVLPEPLRPGLLFLGCLPSTIQSSIACISIARGNVAAGICAASLSNLLAVAATPLLVSLLLGGEAGGLSWGTLQAIATQLLLPFAAGQLARPLIGGFVARHRAMLGLVDRGSVLLVVYTAFSHAVAGGIWGQVSAGDLAVLVAVCAAMLAVLIALLRWTARAAGLAPAEQIVAVICGSQKSLATGAPMAGLLFAPAAAGMMILPLMVFHQLQLVAASALAQRHAARVETPPVSRDASRLSGKRTP